MFDISNYNITPGSNAEGVASDLNKVYEALENGVSFKDDAGPVFTGLLSIALRLRGKTRAEIVDIVAKAAVANVFDELAERPAPE